MPSASPALIWFRQELRLHDHPALLAAIAAGPVLPVFVLDDSVAWPMGGAARWWLHHALAQLRADLAALGASLLLRRGPAERIIPALANQYNAAIVHASVMMEPAWRQRDAAIGHALRQQGRGYQLHLCNHLVNPEEIRTGSGGIYGVYTPFARAVEAEIQPPPPVPAPRDLQAIIPTETDTLEDWCLLPTKPDWSAPLSAFWPQHADAARQLTDRFLTHAADDYAEGRNRPDTDSTSRLSPYLHFGQISPRAVWHASLTAGHGKSHQSFRRELLWREFAAYNLWHRPTMPEQPLRPAFAGIAWRDAPKELQAWQRGRTGIPIVDAGMRQLWQTGWMHNRVRMIAASFLVKHLLINWSAGQAWFWDTLVDADLASNSASWQWVTGCGIDSQPYFRVFNPVTQGEKFDPDGTYVRHYVPELAGLPTRYIHAPWLAPPLELAACGIRLGSTYPHPLVDLAEGRNRALSVYKASVKELVA